MAASDRLHHDAGGAKKPQQGCVVQRPCPLTSWCKQGFALAHVHATDGPSQGSWLLSPSASHAQAVSGLRACRYGGLWKNHHKDMSGRNKVPEAATAQGPHRHSSSPARKGAAAGAGATGEGGGSRQALRAMLLAEAASEGGVEDVSDAGSDGEQQAACVLSTS